MADMTDNAYTHSHRVVDDGTVAFKCSTDVERWPWLALDPSHPTVVQSVNFWASVEAGRARGALDPTKRSALTYARWRCGAPGVGHATHGLAEESMTGEDDNKLGVRLTFFDAEGELVCRLVGAGVVFRTRDFQAWRDDAKKEEAVANSPADFRYAEASALGVASDVERFLSPMRGEGVGEADGLITKRDGFMPRHPYHGGSGDHVNANQLADAGLQFAHLANGGARLRCTGGEMSFTRYVELESPFTLTQTSQDEATGAISMQVRQGGHVCTEMTLWTEPA